MAYVGLGRRNGLRGALLGSTTGGEALVYIPICGTVDGGEGGTELCIVDDVGGGE